MIRPATLDDIPKIARLGEEFHAAAGWSDVASYSAKDCAASLVELMHADEFILLVAETDQIVGMAAGMVFPIYFNRSHVSGEELFWWVTPDAPQMTGIRLLDALEQTARAKGAQSWQMKCVSRLNGERMARLYEHRGYRTSEASFVKRF